MESKEKNFYLNLFVDEKNTGFDVIPEMIGYENVIVMDNSKSTTSHTLCVNIQDKFL